MKRQLEEFLPYLESCIGNIDNCKDPTHERSLFYVAKNPRLSEFVRTFYDLDLANVEYKEYLEERNLFSIENIEDRLDELSLDDLLAILTLFIRNDRFVTGFLISVAETGLLYKVVKRICEYA